MAPNAKAKEDREKLLDYRGVPLCGLDFQSAIFPEWYTDRVLHFFQEYLVASVIKPAKVAGTLQPRIKLMDPSLVAAFKDGGYTDDNIALHTYGYVLAPLNVSVNEKNKAANKKRMRKNLNKDDADGLHWSLILIDTRSGIAFHYDNSSFNEYAAQAFVNSYQAQYGKTLVLCDMAAPEDNTASNCGPIVQWLMTVLVTRLVQDSMNAKLDVGDICNKFNGEEERFTVWGLMKFQYSILVPL